MALSERSGTGLILLKYLIGFLVAVLLTHKRVVETIPFSETNIDLEFSGTELHQRPKSTVCQPNVTTYQCVCEDGYAWSYNNCKTHKACDDICVGSCGCTSGILTDGEMCALESVPSVPPPSDTAYPTTNAYTATSIVTRKVLKMSLRVNTQFDRSLNNPNEAMYQKYSNTIKSAIDDSYTSLSMYIKNSVKVTKFRPGSIIADYEISVTTSSAIGTNSAEFGLANTEVVKTLSKAGIPVTLNAFSEIEEKNLSTAAKWYPFQKMELKCTNPESVMGKIKWTVNDQDPALDTVRYFISPDGSTLIVNNATEKDNGRYSCVIERASISYIQWQIIVLEERPNIVLSKNEIKFECVDSLVQLTCCEAKYAVEWIPVHPGDKVTPPGLDGCITLKHKIIEGSCGNETLTCQLKDPLLKDFDYGWRRITVQKVKGEFSCNNDTLGVGNENQFVMEPCEKNWDGIITYQCTSGEWAMFSRKCVLQIISNLKRKVEVMIVDQIPEFVAQLSNATVSNSQEITESPLTIQTTVEILVNIASISQNIIISKPVMENFLKTVDILVSDEAATSWQSLSKENTSVSLLSSVEDISSHLTEGNFSINEKYIELNRTVIDNSYTGKSSLLNSVTEILIPQVHKPTSVTIIVFTTLDNVLPTRDSNNGSGTSEVRINGDVVVLKVNETLNNISFAFDINDQSLGNPQCVFWNFDLDAWDSTGCEVKPTGYEIVICECNHTSSFSILMSPSIYYIAYITYIGVGISVTCLILCLIVEAIVWKSVRRNDTSHARHVSIINIAVALLFSNVCFTIGASIDEEQQTPVARCSPVVFFMHFFYLAVFFWVFISALLLFYRTVMVFSQMSRARMMGIAFIVGYGASLLIAVITVASTAGPQNYISRQACWLNWDESKALLAFVIPALIIVAVNLVVLIVVLCKIFKRGVGAATQPDGKQALVVIARCLAIFTPAFAYGITWGFGIGTMVSRDLSVNVVFSLFISLQGFVILVFGTLLDSKVREELARKLSLSNLTSSNCTRVIQR